VKEIIKDIDLKLISDEVICRLALNHGKVGEYAVEMIGCEGYGNFPPIHVFERGDGSYINGDGRTRYAAAEQAELRTIPCIVHPKTTLKDILIFAFNANYAVGNEMTHADGRQTIMRLIGMGCSRKYIQEHLRYNPRTFGILYRQSAQNILRKKCCDALTSMSDNPKLSTEDAARLHGLEPAELASYIKRDEGKKGKSCANQIHATIHLKGKAFSAFQANILKTVMQRSESGEMSRDDVRKILAAFDDETGKHRKNLANWQNRFDKKDGHISTPPLPYSVSKTKAGLVMKPAVSVAQV
jgi:surface antigen